MIGVDDDEFVVTDGSDGVAAGVVVPDATAKMESTKENIASP